MVNYYVSTTGNDANDGKTLGTAVATVSQAITLAANSDTVWIADGTYTVTGYTNITKEVTIRSVSGNRNNVIFNNATNSNIFMIQANNVTIRDITLQASNSGASDALITIDRGSDGTILPTLYQNILITNNNLKMYAYGIALNGKDVTITSNAFSRNGGIERISCILVYYIRGTTTIQYNTHLDTLRTRRIIYLTNVGTDGSQYLDRVNSKGGTLIISNNTIDTSVNTAQRPVLMIQDYFNLYNYGPVGADTNYNSGTKLTMVVDSNVITANSTVYFDMLTTYLTTTTCLNAYNTVTISNNTLNYANVGMLKIDSASAKIIDSTLINTVYIFYVYSNTINNFVLRLDYTGDQAISQNTALILPANLASLENIKFISTAPPTLNQTITFPALAERAYNLGEIVSLAAYASSGLPVSFVSSNPDIAEIFGNTLIIRGVGTVIITASQSGNILYNPAPNVQQSQIIYKLAEVDPTTNTGKLSIGACAINFLLISDGGAVLRYST